MNYIFFQNLPEFFQALSLCWHEDLFPQKILRTEAPASFGAPTAGFRDLERMARQHGWTCSFGQPVEVAEVALTSLLGATWSYKDPLGTARVSDYYLDVSLPTYLLGARTEEEAHLLLVALTKGFVNNIRIIPVALRPEIPFGFFWLVSAEYVPLDVLRSAPRAWWGPVGQSRNARVLLEWPYSLDLPDDFLQRVPWESGDGYVLLSKSSPEVLIVSGGIDNSASWEAFGDFRAVATQVAQSLGNLDKVRFPVDLRFTRNDLRLDQRERIARLEEEIGHRQRQLATLREEADLRAIEEPEPLLLYYSDNESEVPRDLRRLLIESCDQPGGLDGLYYARLDSASFPKGLDQPYPVVHALTTAGALGLPKNPDITAGRRLLDYIPGVGARPRFDLVHDWTPDLHLFVPHGEGLNLYPRLRPSKAAAEKFGDALFGPTVNMEERRQSIILLVEGDRHHVNACHLDKRGFRPLVSAFEWECAIDVAPAGLFVSQNLHKAARSALIEGISDSFYDAVKNEGLRRLNHKKTQLVAEANAEADRMKTLNRQLVAMRDSAKQLTLLTTRVHAEFSHLAPEVHSFSQLVLNTSGRVRQMAELADALSNSARELHAAEGKLSTLRDEIKRLTLETRTGKLR